MRYRVIEKNNNYYLLDTEETPLFHIVPFLTWFHKYKIYAIDDAQAQYFMESKGRKEKEVKKVNTSLIVPITLPFSIILGRILIDMGVNDVALFQSTAFNIATLILTIMAIGYFWRSLYKRNGEKVKHVFNNRSLQTHKIKLYTEKKKDYLKMFLFWLASVLFIIMGVGLLVIEGLLIGLISFGLFYFAYTFSFRFFPYVGEGYKSVFVD